jgi:hypothetical protein
VAISEVFPNTATISTTEYFLAANSTTKALKTDDGVYQLWLELNALARGDKFLLRAYEKVLSTSTDRIFQSWTFANAQTDPVFPTPSFILLHGWDFSLVRLLGADRSISWSLRKVA